MFLKNLKIYTAKEVIRDITFHNGLNLIIDDTSLDDKKKTGNNVGKTTVLKLIYFCLGGDGKNIYTDQENKSTTYDEIKNFLINNSINVSLTLIEDLENENSRMVLIERNFLNGKRAIYKINGNNVDKKDFEQQLAVEIFQRTSLEKPSFKQIISHNIRYTDRSINNTLEHLNEYAKDTDYEALYLYLLGLEFKDGAEKAKIIAKIKQLFSFKIKLEENGTKGDCETRLAIVQKELERLNEQKSNLNINPHFQEDLNNLDNIKNQIRKIADEINHLKLRKNLINEALADLKNNTVNINTQRIKLLYQQAKMFVENIQRTFENLINYHNKMIIEKSNFIAEDLPQIEQDIKNKEKHLEQLIKEEVILGEKVSKSDTMQDFDKLITQISDISRRRGQLEEKIIQINKIEDELSALQTQLNLINDSVYSKEYEEKVKEKINVLNSYFAKISNDLYGKQYALSVNKKNTKNGNLVYKFSVIDVNMSSGQKQGEILCFDLAYILFADNQHIPCLHFLLNDKKELMHNNQLHKVSEFLKENKLQLVFSVLKDKLPAELISNENVILKLSQENKLFRV